MTDRWKPCCSCRLNLPLSAFYRDPRRSFGVTSYCRDCHQQCAIATRDQDAHRARSREWMRRRRAAA